MTIAYFSMEIALESEMPTYSGGLGVLAGDLLRAAADQELPLLGVTLLHRRGYFYQRLDPSGGQTEEQVHWAVDDYVQELQPRVQVELQGRTVHLRAFRHDLVSTGRVPVFLLDSDLPENAPEDRALTQQLYGGDERYRLAQEALLGIGGVRMLQALGFAEIRRFHMNEGHSALLALELFEQLGSKAGERGDTSPLAEQVRRQCVFTTHTPVPAALDRFPRPLVEELLGRDKWAVLERVFGCGQELNMTELALTASHYVNGVARSHGKLSREMFPGYHIDHITNGVHASTWVCEPFAHLFDKYLSGWREENSSLRAALGIPRAEVRVAHRAAKRKLFELVERTCNVGLDLDHLTLGFARRMTAYKRPTLLFTDLERLRAIVDEVGPLQVLYAGKAHPRDVHGKSLIREIFAASEQLAGKLSVAYLPNYDVNVAKCLASGVDLWLNTPQPPWEASGTSGMKAALNAVPSLSTLDGWWIEGCIEGVTGWGIDGRAAEQATATSGSRDAHDLYDKLANVIGPLYYQDNDRYVDVMRHAVALNGSHFNTQRMLQQYWVKAYRA